KDANYKVYTNFVTAKGDLLLKSWLPYMTSDYHDGLTLGSELKGKEYVTQYKDQTGKLVLTMPKGYTVFDSGLGIGRARGEFKEGLVRVQNTSTKLWGYMNKQGQVVISAQYDKLGVFEQGVALAKRDGKYMVINKKGEKIMDADGDTKVFANGMIGKVHYDKVAGTKYIVYNKDATQAFVISPYSIYPQAVYFVEDHFVYTYQELLKPAQLGIMDTKGNVIYHASGFNVDAIAIFDKEANDYIIKESPIIIYEEGKPDQRYYMNLKGEKSIAPDLRVTYGFENGMAPVRLTNGKVGYVRADGTYLWEPSK
ncbi:MAG: WG repeat-containing protein, partial [Cellulosilyticaceae bacterium]